MTVGAACGYGVLHDLITTRICLEYFTVFHPPIFGGTQDPTLLALSWGIIATWWVGLPLGCLLALAARHGSWPKLTARDLRPGLLGVLAAMALCAFAAGIVGYHCGDINDLFPDIPTHTSPAFNADFFAHNASYFSGSLGGLILSGMTIWRRRNASKALRAPITPPVGS